MKEESKQINIENAYSLVTDKLEKWIEAIIAMLPNLVVAILIVIVFYFIARLVRNLVSKLLDRMHVHRSLSSLVESVVYVIVILIGLFIALGVLELDKTVTSLLAGVGVIGLALGFAFQDTAANFVSGVFLAVRSPFRIDDIVETGGVMGKVQKISLRSSLVRTFQGIDVIIPNKDVFQNPIHNYSRSGKRRVDLQCGISYGDDLEKVKQVTLSALEGLSSIDQDEEITFFYDGFGDSSINFTVRAWVNNIAQADFLQTRHDMIVAVKKAFDENDIMIPFPIRTLDFGIKGGEKLNEMLVGNGHINKSDGK
jgi:small conductance mechanosensitive channel